MEVKNMGLMRKPFKKAPVVKQTKGSLLRMIKSNPLIGIDDKIKKELGITDEELKRLGHIPIVKSTMSLNIHKKNIGEDKSKSNRVVRRSFSAENFNERSRLSSGKDLNRTYSEENLTRNQSEKLYNFKTPQNKKYFITTPSTITTNPKKYLVSPTPENIKMNLNKWLSKRGKSMGAYHHLKYFGIPLDEIEEEKENIEQKPPRSESYEALQIPPKESEYDTNANSNIQSPFIDYEFIAKDALNDLYKLIQDGYSSEQCSEWLTMIRDKCKNLEEEPTYWECRAALEEQNENLPNAILYYKTAIIKGAEIESVNGSLDMLLEKFSLLNITSSVNAKEDKSKRRVIMDARNVFKSTIIQFAVQERDKKKNVGNKLVTPVRRSARLSCYSNSKGVNLCSSFKNIEDNDNVNFKSNKFLSVRYN
ncbi:uncharacterized protein [Onthophagus taurus]|uniref:uncharacterized protein n=1 Tax=Onthophagus taurus TaxID=166361 RepID=UPI0039BE771C